MKFRIKGFITHHFEKIVEHDTLEEAQQEADCMESWNTESILDYTDETSKYCEIDDVVENY